MTGTVGNTSKKRKLQPVSSGGSLSPTAGKTFMTEPNCHDEEGSRRSGISEVKTISYVEFYSGVGGWTMALEEALQRLSPVLSLPPLAAEEIQTSMPASASAPASASNPPIGSRAGTCRYKLKRLAALDHSDLCVKVFSHNFSKGGDNGEKGNTKRQSAPKSFSIERMPIKQLEEWSADVWVMSPPCQPHTRQHNTVCDQNNTDGSNSETNKRDLDDPRSKSFLKICEWLEGTTNDHDGNGNVNSNVNVNSNSKKSRRILDECLPSLIFLENVVGFESSSSFQRWRSALRARGYQTGHFHLTPTQVRLPNDRPRYYSVAIRFPESGGELRSLHGEREHGDVHASTVPSLPSARSLLSYVAGETKPGDRDGTSVEGKDTVPQIWKAIPELRVTPEDHECATDSADEIPPISSFLDPNSADPSRESSLRVPEKVLKNKSAWCFDIVCPADRRSSCFTHSYGRFVRGTGSILYEHNDPKNGSLGLLPPEEREFSEDWMSGLDPSRLRYFSGMELARLFGFSKNFSFPSDASPKQQWKLMGNSLNVGVASKLVEFGFLLRYHYCVDRFSPDKGQNEKVP